MFKVPIVFATDDNMVIPCGVTITSLLMNADKNTFYTIYILYDAGRLKSNNIENLKHKSNSYIK